MNPIADSTTLDPLARADALLRDGDTDQALAELERASDDRRCLARLREWRVGNRQLPEATRLARQLATGDDAEALVSDALLHHLANDFGGAAQRCQRALQQFGEQAHALNHLARALHNLGRTEDALAAFERALALQPAYPEAACNLGHVLRARGQLHKARQAFEQALALAPGFVAARVQLGNTLYMMEHADEALAAFEQALAQAPDEVEALVGAGLALHLLGRLGASEQRYRQALALAPEHATGHFYLGCLLNEKLDSAGAIEALERALALAPDDVEAWTELAGVFEQSSRLDDAERAVQRGLALAPQHPALALEAAKLERRRGDARAAANRLRLLDPRRLPPRTAQQYWFELGQALDRLDDVAGAMSAIEAGNQLAARSVRRAQLDPAAFDRNLDRLIAWTRAGAPGARSEPDDPADDQGADLCFLIGMPRSGTTLLDTMLAAHPDVYSVEERPTLEGAIALFGDEYPEALPELDGQGVAGLRQQYRYLLAQYGATPGTRLIVDKLPLRCLHVGLIRRLFPRAKLLFALRHPGDVVLSNYMQQYAPNEAFIHFDTLDESARIYDRVLGLWQASLEAIDLAPGYVRYEALIDDPAGELQRVCEFLGITFDPTMLDADARRASRERVRTNSYQQVDEPIYQRAAGRWQRYRPWLEPHIERLAPHAARWGYSFD